MKKWENPEVKNLSVQNTIEMYCPWQELDVYKKEEGCTCDFTNPDKKPTDQHSDYVWCNQHNRWHPKQHGPGES